MFVETLFFMYSISADASVGSVLMRVAVNPAKTGLKNRARSSEILMDYIDTVANELCPSAFLSISMIRLFSIPGLFHRRISVLPLPWLEGGSQAMAIDRS